MQASKKIKTNEGSVIGAECKLRFPFNVCERDLRLIEAPEELVEVMTNGSNQAYFLGSAQKSDAVLCTKDRTYHLKKVETSNQVFLSTIHDNGEYLVHTNCSYHYEVTRNVPKLSLDVLNILKRTEYKGIRDEKECPPLHNHFLSYSELQTLILASKQEYEDILHEHGIVELNHKMRLISSSARLEVIQLILDTIIENDWEIDQIDELACKEEMVDVDIMILRHSLSFLGTFLNGMWSLSSEAVWKFAARIVFFSEKARKTWRSDDFMVMWAARCPVKGAPLPPLECLRGIALNLRDQTDICLLDAEHLPLDLRQRLQRVFEVKSELLVEELLPYVMGYYGAPGQPSTALELILLHCKVSEDNNCILKA